MDYLAGNVQLVIAIFALNIFSISFITISLYNNTIELHLSFIYYSFSTL